MESEVSGTLDRLKGEVAAGRTPFTITDIQPYFSTCNIL